MSRPIALWGLLMCLLATIGETVFGFDGPQSPALLYGIGGFMVALGVALAVSRLGRNREDAVVQSAPDISPPTTFAALGLVVMAVGGVAGLWAVYAGGGMVLAGLLGVLREGRAQRRTLRRARRNLR
jgi:hypothetical protein